jgi:hypothetical protein
MEHVATLQTYGNARTTTVSFPVVGAGIVVDAGLKGRDEYEHHL